MRYLKIVLALIALIIVAAVGILVVMGLRPDSNRIHTSIVVNRPAADVWPFLYEEQKLKSWISWLHSVSDSQPPVLGKQGDWVMLDANNGNQAMKIHNVVTAVEPNRRLSVNLGAEGGFTGTATYLLEEQNGRTTVSIDSRYNLDSALFKLIMPLVINSATKKMNSDFMSLKRNVEALPH